MKNITRFITLTIATALLASCGPEKSQLDLERETRNERLNQKARENARLVGEYSGQATYNDTVLGDLTLTIYALELPGTPGDADTPFVPTLQGQLLGYIPFLVTEGQDNSKQEPNIDIMMTNIVYDGGSKVILKGPVIGKEDDPLKTSLVINSTFNGTDTLEGTFFSPRGIKLPNDQTTNTAHIVLKKK